MLKRTIALLIGAALCAALLSTGCNQTGAGSAASTPPAPSAPSQAAPLHDTADAAPPSKTPLKDSIVALLEQDSRTFPAGTHLNSVNLKEGVATLDFSKE